MKQKNVIIFDLDGTIIDSEIGITASVQYTLAQYDIHIPLEDLTPFIGPPLVVSLMERHGFSDDKAKEALKIYRAHFNENGVHANSLYKGVDDMIRNLYAQNKTLLIATTKPWKSAVEILDVYGLLPYFIFVSGSEMDGTRTDKTEVLEHGLKYANITDISQCVMVGDTKYDIIGANNVKMDSIAVLYGFGEKEDIEQENPTHMADTVEVLEKLLELY